MLILFLSVALADIPSDEPETCLMERYDSAHCASCDASFEGRPDCEALEAEGREQACKSQGASVWSEIWCEPGHTQPLSGKDDDGCSTAGGPLGLGAAGLALTLLLARRRS